MASNQTHEYSNMQLSTDSPPSMQPASMNFGDRNSQHGGQSRMDSNDAGYSGTPDKMGSISGFDPSSPEKGASACSKPHSYIAIASKCPIPRIESPEIRALSYLRRMKVCGRQTMEALNGQWDQAQHAPTIRNISPYVRRQGTDRHKSDISSLNDELHKLNIAADRLKDNNDSLNFEHNLQSYLEFQERRMNLKLQAERQKLPLPEEHIYPCEQD